MRVADLIEELRAYPADAEVTTATISVVLRRMRSRLRYSARLARAEENPS